MVEAIGTYGNPGRGAHKHAMDGARCVYKGRGAVASLFGAVPQQVVFTSSATESLNMAIMGLLSAKDHVITTVLEHNSVLRPLYYLQSKGLEMSTIGMHQGCLDYDSFERCLKPNTKAIVVTAASNVTGLLVDLKFVSNLCKRHGLFLIVDAAQTAGIIPIDMADLGISALCFTGHKSLFGSQGVGGLCVNPQVNIMPTKFGGTGVHTLSRTQPAEMPDALEAGTLNTPGIAGLAAGIEYICAEGIGKIFAKAQKLAEEFYAQVSSIPSVKVYSNFSLPHVPIVTLNIGRLDSALVEHYLANEYGISVRGGFHCAPLLHKALGTEGQGAVRFSFSSFNTTEEVETAVRAVREIAMQNL